MKRERLASFIGNFGGKMSDIYYDIETKEFYVHYKQILENGPDDGLIQFFNTEDEAEEAARKYAFGEKYGERDIKVFQRQ